MGVRGVNYIAKSVELDKSWVWSTDDKIMLELKFRHSSNKLQVQIKPEEAKTLSDALNHAHSGIEEVLDLE